LGFGGGGAGGAVFVGEFIGRLGVVIGSRHRVWGGSVLGSGGND
jgi:hypothetical protein